MKQKDLFQKICLLAELLEKTLIGNTSDLLNDFIDFFKRTKPRDIEITKRYKKNLKEIQLKV